MFQTACKMTSRPRILAIAWDVKNPTFYYCSCEVVGMNVFAKKGEWPPYVMGLSL